MAKQVVSVVNQKGGVGKTTTSINIAAQLAANHKKVLLIDLDPQGNTTGGLGFAKNQLKGSTYELLSGTAKLSGVVTKSSVIGLDVICSNSELAGAEVEMVAKHDRESILQRSIENANYDCVIIDCPPSLGLLTINALTASHLVLIPVQTEYYALEGLSQLLSTIQSVKQATNPNLELLGVLLTMYDKRTSLAAQVKNEIDQYFGDKVFKTTIPRNIRLAEAPSFGLTVFDYDKRSKGAKAYKAVAKEVMTRLSQ